MRNPFASFCLLFCVIAAQVAIAQKQNNQWRFGPGSAIDFNTDPPTFPTDCALPTFVPEAEGYIEATASIADKNTGELLFYTDGKTVWNRLNLPMPNGVGIIANDYLSAWMGVVIVPVPGSCTRYYAFFADDGELEQRGITYCEIDMTLDNGLGDIMPGRKNLMLYENVSEMLMAYPNSGGDGYWLLTNAFPLSPSLLAAFEITEAGIDTIPVLSSNSPNGVTGKLNPQGTKFATIGNDLNEVMLYDFNNATGEISNPVTITAALEPAGLLAKFEFSPNGNYLYASGDLNFVQFDVSSGDATTMSASAASVTFGSPGGYYSDCQLGPDGKIYVIKNPFIYCIENPDNPAASIGEITELPNYVTSSFSLPQWIFTLPQDDIVATIATTADSCVQNLFPFSISANSDLLAVSWDFDDPASAAENSSSSFEPEHTFSGPGTYEVTAFATMSCGLDTASVTLELEVCDTTAVVEPETCRFLIPSVFTPNNDGRNDRFYPSIGCTYTAYELTVFNRWGTPVFQTNRPNEYWNGDTDGTASPEGVYYYTFSYRLAQGTQKFTSGYVQLLR
jgi:gliding motility-associated-like protein